MFSNLVQRVKKIKLSQTTWLALGIGIFVIATASLGMAYSQQANQQSQLDEELSLAQLRLEKYLSEPPSSEKEDLESRLAQAESQLEAAMDTLSQPVESIDVSNIVFKVAQDCDVEIIEISSSFPTSKKLGDITFSSLPLRVRIEGDVPNLINFILKWTEKYSTGAVVSVEITVPRTPEGEETEEVEEAKSSADLALFIYTYEGN